MFLLKRSNRNLKVGITIGGGGLSHSFSTAVASATSRQNLINNIVLAVKDFGLDFVSIDWEFPVRSSGLASDDANLISFLAGLRSAFDNIRAIRQSNFGIRQGSDLGKVELYYASAASTWFTGVLSMNTYSRYVDVFQIMAYDYCGDGWCNSAFHHANLMNSSVIGLSSHDAINNYINSMGIPASKISLGIPAYGKMFGGTNGFNRPFTAGLSINQQTPTYRSIVSGDNAYGLRIANAIYDSNFVGTYIYNSSAKVLTSFDDNRSVGRKTQYAFDRKLNGLCTWSLASDADYGNSFSLLRAMNSTMTTNQARLNAGKNWLLYPDSSYANIKLWYNSDLAAMQADISADRVY
jgi:chitinase